MSNIIELRDFKRRLTFDLIDECIFASYQHTDYPEHHQQLAQQFNLLEILQKAAINNPELQCNIDQSLFFIYHQLLTITKKNIAANDLTFTHFARLLLSAQILRNQVIPESNWWCLFASRVNQLLDDLSLPFQRLRGFSTLHAGFERLSHIFPYLIYTYYGMRFWINAATLLKHTLPGPWMPASERALGWQTRAKIHWQRRSQQISNDALCAGVGLAFLFLVSTQVGMGLILGLYVFDLFNISYHSFRTLRNQQKSIQKLDQKIQQLSANPTMTQEKSTQIAQLNQLKQGIKQQQKELKQKFIFDITTASAMLIGMTLITIGVMAAANPALLIAGSAIVVGACMVELSHKKGWHHSMNPNRFFQSGSISRREKTLDTLTVKSSVKATTIPILVAPG